MEEGCNSRAKVVTQVKLVCLQLRIYCLLLCQKKFMWDIRIWYTPEESKKTIQGSTQMSKHEGKRFQYWRFTNQ